MRRRSILIALSVGAAMAAVTLAVYAGNPDNPPGPPETTTSYTLEDIYNRLVTGAAGTPITFTEPISGPSVGTMHSLNDIVAVAPVLDNANGATAAHVLTGHSFWGLTSDQWGATTGAMPDNGAVTIVPTTTSQAIAMGYHNGSGHVAGDADLVAASIVTGTTIFGVAGSAVRAGGEATDADVLSGVTYSNDSGPSTGGMPDNGAVTIVPTTTSQAIAMGYHDGSGTVAGDADLLAAHIAQGTNLFGVVGTLRTYYAGVPKTGQTTSYATGDDGDLEMGVEWTSPRFITSTTGIVTDTLTGLVWLQNASCFGRRTWSQAVADANNLASGSCGLSDGSSAGDWRLPNARELPSLVHYGVYAPAVPNTAGTGKWSAGDPFAGVQSDGYWTSSTMAAATTYGWIVAMGDGSVRGYLKTLTYFVWPVRGGR